MKPIYKTLLIGALAWHGASYAAGNKVFRCRIQRHRLRPDVAEGRRRAIVGRLDADPGQRTDGAGEQRAQRHQRARGADRRAARTKWRFGAERAGAGRCTVAADGARLLIVSVRPRFAVR
jgi:hypothetical protein